jgi:hypothetical protein
MAATFSSKPQVVPLRRATDRLGLEAIVSTLQRLERSESLTQKASVVPAPPPPQPAAVEPPAQTPDADPPRSRWLEATALAGLLGIAVLGGWWMGQPHTTTVQPEPAQPTAKAEPVPTAPTQPTLEVIAPADVDEPEPELVVQPGPTPVARPAAVQPTPLAPVKKVVAPVEEEASEEVVAAEEVEEAVAVDEIEDLEEAVAVVVEDPVDEAPAPDLWSGRWEGTSNGRPLSADLVVVNGSVSGTATVSAGAQYLTGPVTGRVSGGAVELNFSSGGREMTFSGATTQQTMSGDVLVSGRNRGDWSLSKAN